MPELTTLQKCEWILKRDTDPVTHHNAWSIGESLMWDGETDRRNVEYIDKLYAKLKGLETNK